MTVYEIASVIIDAVALVISFCSFIVALLNFLDKRNNKRK